MDGFRPPAGHTGFLAKQLFAGDGSEHSFGEIIGGAIAYLEPGGGGPTQMHTHRASHPERMPRAGSAGPAELAKPAGPTDYTESMKPAEKM